MKKTFLIIGLLIAGAFTVNAQSISENAIGLRLGDNDGFGAEVSYQKALGDNNRLEIDLGLRNNKNYDGFKATGIYQWVWNIEGGFNWYAGVGGGLGNYSGKDNKDDFSETLAFAAGAMIFVVVEEVIPETQRDKYTDIATLGFIGGFIVMMSLDVGLG